MRRTVELSMGAVVLASLAASAQAQNFEMKWSTVDGGGIINTMGGNFALSGTLGQPDAGEMSGGNFVLKGGFWPGATTGGGGGGCNGGESIKKAKCKAKNGVVKKASVVIKGGTPNELYTAVLDTGESLESNAKSNGKAKFVFKGGDAPPCGANGVTICDLKKAFDCGC